MKTTYELTSGARQGSAKVTFEDRVLIAIELGFKPALDEARVAKLFHSISPNEDDVWTISKLGLKVSKESAPNEKLALFCRIYERHKNIKYKVSAADSGKIKQINPSEELLHFYFRSENFLFKGKQSIANLVKYWNELRADFAGQGKTKFPDDWQPEMLKKLTPQDTIHYYAHLRKLGLKEIRTEAGQIVGFK